MTLRSLLDDGLRWAPEYRGGLSNHLPMALGALHGLGAGEQRLADFAASYSRRLEPVTPDTQWSGGNDWHRRLGEPDAWPAYRSLFRGWIANDGAERTLKRALPRLLPGCGAAAFHGAIRTAWAVTSSHAGELADGLAYWSCTWLPLTSAAASPPASGDATSDPEPLLRRLPVAPSNRTLISERMSDAAGSADWQRAVAPLIVGGDTLARLARLAARAYAGSGNFTALHLVTGCHAMRVLMRFADDRLAATRAFWLAFAAAVSAAGLRTLPPAPLLPWPEIVAAALSSDDEHLIKLVCSAREEERAYGGDDWRRAASRAAA